MIIIAEHVEKHLIGKENVCKRYIEVLEVLGVDPTNDDDNVHPESFCNSCYLTAKRALSKCTSSSRQSITWTPHEDNSCLICDVKCIGGRPKKVTSSGRPTLLTQQIRSYAFDLPPFSLDQVIDQSYIDSITCSLCKSAVNSPVEVVPCQSVLCCNCLLSQLDKKLDQFQCPGCTEYHDNHVTSFTNLSPLAQTMIKNIMVRCEKCHRPVKLININKGCAHHLDNSSTLVDATNLSSDAHPSLIEKQVATNVVTRLLHQSDSPLVKLPTGGQVSTLIIEIIVTLT